MARQAICVAPSDTVAVTITNTVGLEYHHPVWSNDLVTCALWDGALDVLEKFKPLTILP